MKRSTAAGLLVVIGAAAALAVAFPRLNDVETGRTPAYPDLQPQTYRAPEAVVARAARETIESLPGFALVGSGSGSGGTALQATARPPLVPLESELTVRIKAARGRTTVSVKSRSPGLPWDLGQNARHVRAFQQALDARVR